MTKKLDIYILQKILKKSCTYKKVFLFIQYNDTKNIICKMSNKEFFDNLLKNSRYSRNNDEKFNKIINIAKSEEAYHIMFTSFDNFRVLLKKLDL